MKIRTYLGFALSAALLLGSAAPSLAQEPPPPVPQEQAKPSPSSVDGDLVSVDAQTKMITIKSASGEELKFAYTDTTEISGAQDNAAGLATLREGKVTVHYTEDAESKARTATRIVVHPGK